MPQQTMFFFDEQLRRFLLNLLESSVTSRSSMAVTKKAVVIP